MQQSSYTCPCCNAPMTVSDGAPVPIDWAQLIALLIQILQSFLGGMPAKQSPKA